MKLQHILLGLAISLVGLLVVLAIAVDMYDSNGYDLNLSEDEDMDALYDLQEKANASTAELQDNVEFMRQRTPGQNESDYNPESDSSEADLQKSALAALTAPNTWLGVYTTMVQAIANILDIDSFMANLFIWFIGLLIIIPVVFNLINSFLRNQV